MSQLLRVHDMAVRGDRGPPTPAHPRPPAQNRLSLMWELSKNKPSTGEEPPAIPISPRHSPPLTNLFISSKVRGAVWGTRPRRGGARVPGTRAGSTPVVAWEGGRGNALALPPPPGTSTRAWFRTLPPLPRPQPAESKPILLRQLTGRSGVSSKEITVPPGLLAVRWSNCSAEGFQVRGRDYMSSRRKEASGAGLYRLLAADLFSFECKVNHVAHHIDLPAPPVLGPGCEALAPEERLPPLLIVNLQLPSYSPPLFGKAHDGPGYSLVLYFGLPPGWEPAREGNRAALELFQRFVHDGVEADGCPTRDRLKLIPHVANPDDWARAAPLSRYEARMLASYADKPLLSRPQHRYFARGGAYLEIDLDVHSYAYLARKALHGFLGRLPGLVLDLGLVVQGNAPDELPEQVFAAARISDMRLEEAQPFVSVRPEELQPPPAPAAAPLQRRSHL